MINQILNKISSSWFEIIIGFFIPIILGVFKLLIDRVTINYEIKKSISLKGMWFCYHKNCNNDDIIELVKFKHHKNHKISYKLKYFNKNKSIISYFSGTGIIKGNSIYSIYCSDNKSSSQIGSFMLAHKVDHGSSDILEGYYFEYNDQTDLIEYSLKKVEKSNSERKIWLSKSYTEVDKRLNEKQV